MGWKPWRWKSSSDKLIQDVTILRIANPLLYSSSSCLVFKISFTLMCNFFLLNYYLVSNKTHVGGNHRNVALWDSQWVLRIRPVSSENSYSSLWILLYYLFVVFLKNTLDLSVQSRSTQLSRNVNCILLTSCHSTYC